MKRQEIETCSAHFLRKARQLPLTTLRYQIGLRTTQGLKID